MTKEKTAKRGSTQRKNEKRNDKIENNETPTKDICNKGFGGKSIVLPRSNFGVGGQDSSPQSLTAHAAKIAIVGFGELACVSLRPKSQIAQHYIDKYNMNVTGMTLSIEVPEILNLINYYDHE